MTKVISVFGSHDPKPGSPEYLQATEVGRLLAHAGYAVANGGYGGTMAAVSQGAHAVGGQVIGVTCSRIERYRGAGANRWLSEEVHYDTLAERVHHLVVNNQGIIVLPGGIGTLSEFALAWNLMQVAEIPPRPLALMGQMWPEVLSAFVRPQYVLQKDLDLIRTVTTPQEAVDHVEHYSGSITLGQ